MGVVLVIVLLPGFQEGRDIKAICVVQLQGKTLKMRKTDRISLLL
jgi:hypothetical protein